MGILLTSERPTRVLIKKTTDGPGLKETSREVTVTLPRGSKVPDTGNTTIYVWRGDVLLVLDDTYTTRAGVKDQTPEVGMVVGQP